MKGKRVFKLLSGILFFILVLSCSLMVLAVEFTADLIQEKDGAAVKSKFYIKDNRTRIETATGIMIVDVDNNKLYSLQPQNKTYLEMPGMMGMDQIGQSLEQADAQLAQIADKKHVGTEEVNGYLCDKYEIIYHDKALGTMTQWVAKKLKYPIKIIYRSSFGKILTEYKNINEEGISDSMFLIPAGYQKQEMPDMSQFHK